MLNRNVQIDVVRSTGVAYPRRLYSAFRNRESKTGVMRHEHVPVEPIAQLGRRCRRNPAHPSDRRAWDVVQVAGPQVALHADQGLRLILQGAVWRHMHDADLDGTVAARRIDAGGLEIDDGETPSVNVVRSYPLPV